MDFYKRIEVVCAAIPYGKAATYGQIALLCGKPKNARQVGYALRRTLAGEGTPAHRIVNASGILSGAQAFDMPQLQKILLEKEGVKVSETEAGWRVDLKRDGWKNTLEDARMFQEKFQEQGI